MTPNDVAIRQMTHSDLAAAVDLQAQSYPPFLLEDEAAFASRLDVAAPYCLVAICQGGLIGYLLAHGWPQHAPPALGQLLSAQEPSEVLFIHDLSVSAAGRGLGIGRRLVAAAFDLAAHDGLPTAELIAVEGAARFWQTLGFAEATPGPALAAKVSQYGTAARWMTRAISPLT